MDPNSDIYAFASITGTTDKRVCGRSSCNRTYASCSIEEKSEWKQLGNLHNTDGDAVRWFCGPCIEYYCNKPTTRRRGTLISLTRVMHCVSLSLQMERPPIEVKPIPSKWTSQLPSEVKVIVRRFKLLGHVFPCPLHRRRVCIMLAQVLCMLIAFR